MASTSNGRVRMMGPDRVIRRHIIAPFLAFFISSYALIPASLAASFIQDFSISWAPDHVLYSPDGIQISLSLDNVSGSAFAGNEKYFFGQINMDIKLVPGNSAGTVTTYYLHSQTANHDEVDFEFLGNVSGQPYILQTNIFNSGTGGREQRIFLWFDPTANFHTYSVLWNQQRVLLSVDGTPIREFPNLEGRGVPYLNKQGMGVYGSIWNGESWATRGGRDKIEWSKAPFTSTYRNYTVDACVWTGDTSPPKCPSQQWWADTNHQTLSTNQEAQLRLVQQKYMVYNYCTDSKRYPMPPLECTTTTG